MIRHLGKPFDALNGAQLEALVLRPKLTGNEVVDVANNKTKLCGGILRDVLAIERMEVVVHVSHLVDVARIGKRGNGVGHASHYEVTLE